MSLVYPDMRFSEVVEERPSLIPVINRFGIRLGLGDKTIKEICDENNIDADFLLTVINTFLNEEYFPEKKLQAFHTSQIIDYLKKTNSAYQKHQLTNIERHLGIFISMNKEANNSLALIGKFFASFKKELSDRIENDSIRWFPYCLKLSEEVEATNPTGKDNIILKLPKQSEEDSVEAQLGDLKSIMIKHLSGEYDENLCYAVIIAINNLEKDIKQQNRIRYRILSPMVAAMENLSK